MPKGQSLLSLLSKYKEKEFQIKFLSKGKGQQIKHGQFTKKIDGFVCF